MGMLKNKSTRRRRQDTTHAVYCITNTQTGQQYVGITVCGRNVRRALTEGRDWALCRSIREYGTRAHEYGLLELVRGRKPAHARERELIREYGPALNTH